MNTAVLTIAFGLLLASPVFAQDAPPECVALADRLTDMAHAIDPATRGEDWQTLRPDFPMELAAYPAITCADAMALTDEALRAQFFGNVTPAGQ